MSEKTTTGMPLPTIPEVVGIKTAVDQLSAVQSRVNDAVLKASETEKEVLKFREEYNKMPTGLMKSHIAEHMGELESEIADNSRKAVNAAVMELNTHMRTIQELSIQLKTKYGKPEVSVKRADKGTNMGTVTDSNIDQIREALSARGYFAVQFNPLGDGIHYQVSAQTPSGKVKTGRYSGQILSDWVDTL